MTPGPTRHVPRLLPLLLLPALLALVAWVPPARSVTKISLTYQVAPDSSIQTDVTVFLSGSLWRDDSIRYTAYRNDSLQTPLTTKATTQRFTLGAPAYGQTVTYKVCARVFRGTVASGGFQCGSFSYTRPDLPAPPPPVVDSISVRPVSLSVDPDVNGACAAWVAANPGVSRWIVVNVTAVPACMSASGHPTTAKFCAFCHLTDGTTTMCGPMAGTDAYCDQQYQAWRTARGA